ncbi:MAG: hypothetical protein RL155_464, partial [Actinomycetota bacterium]
MRRAWVAIIFFTAFVLTPFAPARAETLITLSKPASQLADGRFLNNDLA